VSRKLFSHFAVVFDLAYIREAAENRAPGQVKRFAHAGGALKFHVEIGTMIHELLQLVPFNLVRATKGPARKNKKTLTVRLTKRAPRRIFFQFLSV
jgi:hypothetical protein